MPLCQIDSTRFSGLDDDELQIDNLRMVDDALLKSHIQGLKTALATLQTNINNEANTRATNDMT